jgi:hypothetical protein
VTVPGQLQDEWIIATSEPDLAFDSSGRTVIDLAANDTILNAPSHELLIAYRANVKNSFFICSKYF